MYQALLTRRYFTTKVMPLLAALAVVLCTAMVLVVWSVMGGFLSKLVNSGRTLIGDVSIGWSVVGFPYYDELVGRLEKEPGVAAAAPMIETFGQIRMPDGQVAGVLVRGIDGAKYARVSDYAQALWWKRVDAPLRKDEDRRDPRLASLTRKPGWDELFQNGLSLTRTDGDVERPAVVLGIEVSGYNLREPEGYFVPMSPLKRMPDGSRRDLQMFMPREGTVTLSVFPQDSQGVLLNMESRTFAVANEFHSGIYDVDHRTVFANFDALQRLMKMSGGKAFKEAGDTAAEITVDPVTGKETIAPPKGELVEEPARATHVVVRAQGEALEESAARAFAERVRLVYAEFAAAHPGEVPPAYSIRIMTWRDQNRTFISAVEKETSLVLSLFSFISLTAVFLVLAIFWSMVSEKTRDIGTLRAIGAGRLGVAGVWLTYGLGIGVVGSLLGGLLAYEIVHNINPIHEWMGRALGIQVWDPKIYYFSEIPNRVDPVKVAFVLCGGLVSSVLGALIPALRAAWMDPVRALRFE